MLRRLSVVVRVHPRIESGAGSGTFGGFVLWISKPPAAMLKTLPSLLCLAVLGTGMGCAQDVRWATLEQSIRAAYPDVRPLSTDSLAAWLAGDAGPLLFDVRAESEYAVSHLAGARRLDPDARDFSALQDLPKDTPLVTYCSVGYRSAAMARRLHEAGFTNVMNLEGSIFAWANEGRAVYRDGQAVRQVHPYDAVWGRLLKKELRAYAPR